MAKYEGMLNLRLVRTKRKMTQRELGDLVGVNSKAISCYETGLRYPRRDILDKLATALGCEIKDIV